MRIASTQASTGLCHIAAKKMSAGGATIQRASVVAALLIAVFLATQTCADEAREWTRSDGKKVTATFVRLDTEPVAPVVVLLKDGKEFSVPLASLRHHDQSVAKLKDKIHTGKARQATEQKATEARRRIAEANANKLRYEVGKMEKSDWTPGDFKPKEYEPGRLVTRRRVYIQISRKATATEAIDIAEKLLPGYRQFDAVQFFFYLPKGALNTKEDGLAGMAQVTIEYAPGGLWEKAGSDDKKKLGDAVITY